ncbi:hypothetical protein [Micromonospora avicenniae]|uniref:hypothetical protein n=1 Tax=Micromonospora avicenniae TaxID=1198245 RepID=UPI00342E8BEB
MATLATVVLVCGGGLGVVGEDGDGRLRFSARGDEVLPLPTSLRLVSADTCADGGSSGNCTAEFVVMAADEADRTTTVTRLVETSAAAVGRSGLTTASIAATARQAGS